MYFLGGWLGIQALGCASKTHVPSPVEPTAQQDDPLMTETQRQMVEQFINLMPKRIDGYFYDLGISVKNCPNGVVAPDGQYCKAAKGVQLSTPTTTSLMQTLANKDTWLQAEKDCFFPRHSFVAKSAQGKPLGEIQLCFQCDKAKINVMSGTDVVYGLSDGGFLAFSKLCRQLDLEGCPSI